MERLNRSRSYHSSNESHSPIRQARRLNSRAIALSTDPKFKPSSSRTVEPEVHASFTLLRMGWDKRKGRGRGRERAASSPSKLSSIPSAPPSSAVFGFPAPSGFLDRVAKWSRVNIWTVPVGWPWQFSSSHSCPACRPSTSVDRSRISANFELLPDCVHSPQKSPFLFPSSAASQIIALTPDHWFRPPETFLRPSGSSPARARSCLTSLRILRFSTQLVPSFYQTSNYVKLIDEFISMDGTPSFNNHWIDRRYWRSREFSSEVHHIVALIPANTGIPVETDLIIQG